MPLVDMELLQNRRYPNDVCRELLWTNKKIGVQEGAVLRRAPLSVVLRAGQSIKAAGSSTRRLESQVKQKNVRRYLD